MNYLLFAKEGIFLDVERSGHCYFNQAIQSGISNGKLRWSSKIF